MVKKTNDPDSSVLGIRPEFLYRDLVTAGKFRAFFCFFKIRIEKLQMDLTDIFVCQVRIKTSDDHF